MCLINNFRKKKLRTAWSFFQLLYFMGSHPALLNGLPLALVVLYWIPVYNMQGKYSTTALFLSGLVLREKRIRLNLILLDLTSAPHVLLILLLPPFSSFISLIYVTVPGMDTCKTSCLLIIPACSSFFFQ